MKILWISPICLDLRLDAAARLEIMDKLARRGHDVSFLALRSKEKSPDVKRGVNLIELPIRVRSVLSSIVFSLYLFFFLPFYLLYLKPNVVFVESEVFGCSALTGIICCKLRRIRTVFDVRSPPVETVGVQGVFQVFSFNLSVFFAKILFDGITVLTPMMAKDIERKFGVDPLFLSSWPSGVSVDLFSPRKQLLIRDLKERLKIDEGSFVVFYHGSISENRGVLQLVEAMSEVVSKNLNVVLLIVGSGSAFDAVKGSVEEKGLDGNVLLLNRVSYERVPDYIALADVCIIPLPDHPFWRSQNPLKLLEYLAMEKVVIVTDIPAHRSVIDGYKFGIFIPSNAPGEIAKSIVFAYGVRGSLGAWGVEGRRIVEARYTWDAIAGRLDDYLRGLVL